MSAVSAFASIHLTEAAQLEMKTLLNQVISKTSPYDACGTVVIKWAEKILDGSLDIVQFHKNLNTRTALLKGMHVITVGSCAVLPKPEWKDTTEQNIALLAKVKEIATSSGIILE